MKQPVCWILKGRLELIRTVREVKERYGLTVISITHDLEEVFPK